MSAYALRRAGFVAVVAAALAGCVAQPPRGPAAPLDPAQAQANDARRGALRDWALSGRIAVANGNRGGSGRIDWRQDAGGYAIALSAPVTRQSWRLSGDAHGARLEGIEGGPRESADVEQLLLATTGWNIPVRALGHWVRGIGAAADEFGPDKRVYDATGLPARLEQAGWVIDYQEWHPATDAAPSLPRRLLARNGTATVRLIVDAWEP